MDISTMSNLLDKSRKILLCDMTCFGKPFIDRFFKLILPKTMNI